MSNYWQKNFEHLKTLCLRLLAVGYVGAGRIAFPNNEFYKPLSDLVDYLETQKEEKVPEENPAAGPWQPMESAPKDGTAILCYCDNCRDKIVVGRWRDSGGELGWEAVTEFDDPPIDPLFWAALNPPEEK